MRNVGAIVAAGSITLLASFAFGLAGAGCGSSSSDGAPAKDSGPGTDSIATTDGLVDDTGGTSEGGVPAGALEACRKAWTPSCAAWKACAPASFGTSFVDEADCIAKASALCVNVFSDTNAPWTVAQENGCADAVTTELAGATKCESFFRLFGWGGSNTKPLAACVPKGTLPKDAACFSGGECASGYCEYPTGKFCGTCKDRITIGGTCSGARPNACEAGSTCRSLKCTAYGKLDEPCSDTLPCSTELFCSSNKCTKRLADGETCDPSGLVDNGCALAHWCDSSTNKCVPWAVAKVGEPCGIAAATTHTLTSCAYGARCKVDDAVAFTGSCVPAKKEGEACSFSGPFDDECEYGLRCADKVCTRLSPARCGL